MLLKYTVWILEMSYTYVNILKHIYNNEKHLYILEKTPKTNSYTMYTNCETDYLGF